MRMGLLVAGTAVAALYLTGCEDDAPRPKPAPRSPAATAKKKELPKLACAADSSKTEREGKVLGCVVAKDTKIGPITCVAKARVDLYPDGKLKECTLARAHGYNGVPCVAAELGKWYRSGELQRCGLELSFEHSGVKCRDEIELHENGRLHRCPVAADGKLGEVDIPAGSRVTLGADGKAAEVERPADQPFRHESFDCSAVHYYRSGKVKICVTRDEALFAAKKLPPGSKICFDEQGKPSTTVADGCVQTKTLPTKG